jgi:hypothetical protein
MSRKELTEDEYYHWLSTSAILENEKCVSSHSGGPHAFETIVSSGSMHALSQEWGFDGTTTMRYYVEPVMYRADGYRRHL